MMHLVLRLSVCFAVVSGAPAPPAPDAWKAMATGFALGFVSDSPDVMTCGTKLLSETGDFEHAVKHLGEGIKSRNLTDISAAVEEIDAAWKGAAGAEATCKVVEADMKAIVAAIKELHGPRDLVIRLSANMFNDGGKIFGEMSSGEHIYKTGDYFSAGQQMGKAFRSALVGKATPKPLAPDAQKAMAAGFVIGFVSDSADLMTCGMKFLSEKADYEHYVKELQDGIKHRKVEEITHACEKIDAIIKGAAGAIRATCKVVETDMSAIIASLKKAQGPQDLALDMLDNILQDGEKIFSEMSQSEHDSESGDYLTAGRHMGMAFRRTLIGEIPPTIVV